MITPPRVYVETTVVSYLTARPSRDLISAARQEITRTWWEGHLGEYDRVISQLVLDEAAGGDAEAARRRLACLEGLPLLAQDASATRLARRFVRPDCIPPKAKDDAMHLALCAVYGVPYLVTWNFRHLANAENRRMLRRLCEAAGYSLPTICTPDQLLKGEL
jgi:predicted nucleic acid-binding protein